MQGHGVATFVPTSLDFKTRTRLGPGYCPIRCSLNCPDLQPLLTQGCAAPRREETQTRTPLSLMSWPCPPLVISSVQLRARGP